MRRLKHLIDNNRAWVKRITEQDDQFFARLAKQQRPEILWIGCSDSRVPANQIVDMDPGELFVHRNVANVVAHSDLNCLSVVQYAVEVLKVKHIIVCGHYACGGVLGALNDEPLGLIENWIEHIVDIKHAHKEFLSQIKDKKALGDALCELNVLEQVVNVCTTSVVKDAWRNGTDLSIHGWIYDISDGCLRDLDICVVEREELSTLYSKAVDHIKASYLSVK